MIDWDDTRPLLLTLFVILVLITYYIHASEKIVNLEVPLNCVKKVTLVDCDLNVEPPKCQSSKILYGPPTCPIIHLEPKP